jgi:hypothetical protein
MRGGVRPKRQVMSLGGGTKVVEDYTRLDPGQTRDGIDLQYPVEVLRHVDHYRNVARLTGETRSRPAGNKRRSVLPADFDRLYHIRRRSRHHNTDGHLPVIGRVCGVQRTGAGIEPDLAVYLVLERTLECMHVDLGIMPARQSRSQI